MKLSKDDVLNITVSFINKYRKYPTIPDLKGLGVSRGVLRQHFDNLVNLKVAAYKQCGDVLFDLERETKLKTPKRTTKTFVITTAVAGAAVDKKFLQNIKSYCEDFKAELIILPSTDASNADYILDSSLKNEIVIIDDVNINSNVFILGIKNNAKTTDPVTGLPRIGQRNGTFIAASPKQRLKYIATGISKYPHAIMSTGAVTLPAYKSKSLLTDKTTYLAGHDHVMGAIILEIENNDLFHFRQIQADKDGSFVDLGSLYKNGRRAKMAPAAFVLGDWHSGETDPVARGCWEDVTRKLKVPRWVIHDGYSAVSTNHHNIGKTTQLAKLANKGLLSLKDELDLYSKELKEMSDNLTEVIVVKSNHDEHLERYLDEGRYVQDPHNHRLSLELAASVIDGHNPIKYYVERIKGLKIPNVKWLERDESYKISNIELGMHGDKGQNGARGNINSMEQAYGNVVFGHSHSPQILRGAWCVGTSSLLQLDYNQGASSWMHTSCLVYPNGQRQLINVIEGKWTTRKWA